MFFRNVLFCSKPSPSPNPFILPPTTTTNTTSTHNHPSEVAVGNKSLEDQIPQEIYRMIDEIMNQDSEEDSKTIDQEEDESIIQDFDQVTNSSDSASSFRSTTDFILPDPTQVLPQPSHHQQVATHLIASPDGSLEFEMILPLRYEPVRDESTGCVKILGQGGYGVVIACWDKFHPISLNSTDMPFEMENQSSLNFSKHEQQTTSYRMVAVKKVKNVFESGAPYRMLREIKIMRHLRHHENIVELVDVYISTHSRNGPYCLKELKDLYIVMGMMQDGDLKMYLNRLGKKKQCIPIEFVKNVMRQLVSAMEYMRSFGVLHRDLKPANVLVQTNATNEENHKEHVHVRISDFGLSTSESDHPGQSPNSMYVVTRYYRSPEVILQYDTQTSSVDSWSLGCIFAELLYMLGPKPIRRPLFLVQQSGQDMKGIIEHLNLITCLLGKPKDLNDIKGADGARDFYEQHFNEFYEEGVNLKAIFPSAPEEALDLLREFLQWNPEKRITFANALKHPFLLAQENEHVENLTLSSLHLHEMHQHGMTNNKASSSGDDQIVIESDSQKKTSKTSQQHSLNRQKQQQHRIEFNFQTKCDATTLRYLYYKEMMYLNRVILMASPQPEENA
ncbi:hypothetical protein FDP41_004265 [Naegleria fowleri]|uniref:Protein kinase domain-containing protein n=1 Tax=Naegleria fowleri TaxID=5763 RepID=A0A6A5BT72_NAEFO|nr:uncharacterized protein FDP41_004265 [Naegleria fowleri]KAF0976970.1 hypothetical protein FDP41_004265 [Naegleria fowleri]